MQEDDFEGDEDEFKALYDNGQWDWDEKTEELVFIPNANSYDEESWISPPAAEIIGAANFRDDIDLIEQQRFRKQIQRKTFEGDVVNLQDIKDIVLYTAPNSLITPSIINILHQPATERFLRALILYNQYYLQISDEMGRRILEVESKIRTPNSDYVERCYKENLEDLRLLIAKEYANILTGSGAFNTIHHMGPSKTMRSLSKKSNIAFESLLRCGIQVVWLALGRKYFNQIELEMHRLFKTQNFNMVEHKIKSNYEAKMAPEERYVLFGECIQNKRMIKACSPLSNEMHCSNVDWRLFGLGVSAYPKLSKRLHYMQDALAAPETVLAQRKITVGILGFLRNRFDTMLNVIMIPTTGSTSMVGGRPSVTRNRSVSLSKSKTGHTSRRKSCTSDQITHQIIPDIELGPRDLEDNQIQNKYPDEVLPQNPCDPIQKRKWMIRASRLACKRAKKRQNK